MTLISIYPASTLHVTNVSLILTLPNKTFFFFVKIPDDALVILTGRHASYNTVGSR